MNLILKYMQIICIYLQGCDVICHSGVGVQMRASESVPTRELLNLVVQFGCFMYKSCMHTRFFKKNIVSQTTLGLIYRYNLKYRFKLMKTKYMQIYYSRWKLILFWWYKLYRSTNVYVPNEYFIFSNESIFYIVYLQPVNNNLERFKLLDCIDVLVNCSDD